MSPSSPSPHFPQRDYGDRFEPAIIVAMIALIIASFIFVGWLWHTYAPQCSHTEYTYCDSTKQPSSQH